MEREDARKLSPQAQHERRRQVVRAYKRGVNRRQIARDLGLSYSSVRMIVNRFKKDGMRG
ncbi:MAG: helix-turn-helix domain-containing protein, partial [Terracidiphilus sp.]